LTHGPLRGKVLVAGGFDGKECVDAAQLFEPSSLTWSATGALRQGRNFATATELEDGTGRVLICGGYDEHLGTLASAEIYEPAGPEGAPAFRSVTARMTSPRELFTAT